MISEDCTPTPSHVSGFIVRCTPMDYLCDVLDTAVEAGATILNVPDTVGYTTPTEMAHLVETVNQRVVRGRDITISVHCHNDLGLAVANSLAALDAGARQIECTINGIGERAGNASLEEIVMALHEALIREYETSHR